jgi:hypothetical protein
MSTCYTPGPWGYTVAIESNGSTTYDIHTEECEQDVAYVQTYPSHNLALQEANARLIASAPMLLEALQFVMTSHGTQRDDAYAAAHAAIDKATGGQS